MEVTMIELCSPVELEYKNKFDQNITRNCFDSCTQKVLLLRQYDQKAQRQLEKLYDKGEISPLAIIADSSSNGMVNAIYPSD